MTEIFLGAIFLFFPLAFIFSSPEPTSADAYGILIPLSIFGITGLFLFIRGFKKVMTDFLTNQKGIDTYGIVLSISRTGVRINKVPEWEAEFITYIPSEHQTKIIKANIGCYHQLPYSEGDYLLLRQYKNDINIIQPTINDFIPSDILELLNDHYDRS